MEIWIVSTFLAFMNYAALSIHVSFCVDVCFRFSGMCKSSGLSGSHSNSRFNSWRTARLVFKGAGALYIPTSSVEGYQFLHIPVFVFFFLIIITTLLCMKWCLMVVLIALP